MFSASHAIASDSPQLRGRPRVLLVEDEADTLAMLRELIAGAGCQVMVAKTLAAARKALGRDQSLSLLLTDVALPDGDGLSLLPLLQRNHPTASTIVLTGQPSLERAVRAMRDGAADFVAKPFDNQELLGRVQLALQKHAVAVRQQRRLSRLRGAVKRLGVARRLVSKKVDLLCNDLVGAYSELSRQMDVVRTEESFRKQIAGSKDLEQMLCQTMDWLVRQVGLCNIGLWLATENGGFQLGAYMKYTLAGEPPVVRAMQQGVIPRTMHDGFLHCTGRDLILARKDELCTPLLEQTVVAVSCTYLGEPLATIVFFREEAKPFSEHDIASIKAIGPVFATTLAGTVRDPQGSADGEADPEQDDSSRRDSRSADDWWKRGEQPPF